MLQTLDEITTGGADLRVWAVNLSRAKELKSTEGGGAAMSEVMQKLLAEGRRSQLIELVKEGLLRIDIAAQKAGMSVEEFKKLL